MTEVTEVIERVRDRVWRDVGIYNTRLRSEYSETWDATRTSALALGLAVFYVGLNFIAAQDEAHSPDLKTLGCGLIFGFLFSFFFSVSARVMKAIGTRQTITLLKDPIGYARWSFLQRGRTIERSPLADSNYEDYIRPFHTKLLKLDPRLTSDKLYESLSLTVCDALIERSNDITSHYEGKFFFPDICLFLIVNALRGRFSEIN